MLETIHTTQKMKIKRQLKYFQLLQTRVLISISDEELVQRLIGRWFNNLRWIGLVENEEAYWLQWTNSDNSFFVNFYLVSRYIIIETNAITDHDKIEAMAGACRIFEQIVMVTRQKLSNIDICRLDAE